MEFHKLVNLGEGRPSPADPNRRVYPALRKHPVSFVSRKNEGRGHVIGGHDGETGPWVTVRCSTTQREYRLRPSQVSA